MSLSPYQRPVSQLLQQRLSEAPQRLQISYTFDEARADRNHWGHLAESAVGAHLVNTADADTKIHCWREASLEVDFVLEWRGKLVAIDVKTTPGVTRHARLDAFCKRYP
jgi:uncharacterized protein